MTEKQICDELIELSCLLYVLETALNSDIKPTNDLYPFAHFTKIIRNKLGNLMESIQ